MAGKLKVNILISKSRIILDIILIESIFADFKFTAFGLLLEAISN